MIFNDKDILSKFKVPSLREEAFNEIVIALRERLYWHIRKLLISHDDTDDVLQNTFIKIWNGLKDFRGDAQIFTWSYRIATNEALTFLKSRHKRLLFFSGDYTQELYSKLEADEYFNGDEIQKKLQKAVLSLPEKQRIVFNMKYFDEMKYEDMAEILNTSVGALKASYHHAVKKIENYMETD